MLYCVKKMKKNVIRIGQASIDGSQAGVIYGTGGVSPTLIAGTHGYAMGYIMVKDIKLELIGQMDNSDGTHESQNRVYGPEGLAPTITTQSGGNLQPKFLERKAECSAVGHIEHGTGKHQSNTVWSENGLSPTLTTIENGGTQQIKVIGNYMPGEHEAGRVVDDNGLCPTVKENHGTTTAVVSRLRIRKLTPRECWRLMAFDDEDYDKAAEVNSQTQLYKQAGNSIVVSVLEAILGEML